MYLLAIIIGLSNLDIAFKIYVTVTKSVLQKISFFWT